METWRVVLHLSRDGSVYFLVCCTYCQHKKSKHNIRDGKFHNTKYPTNRQTKRDNEEY